MPDNVKGIGPSWKHMCGSGLAYAWVGSAGHMAELSWDKWAGVGWTSYFVRSLLLRWSRGALTEGKARVGLMLGNRDKRVGKSTTLDCLFLLFFFC